MEYHDILDTYWWLGCMNAPGPWTTDDFNALSWHDVHVYGFRFESFDEEYGSADLVLDIDFILKWENVADHFRFTVCQAELRFHKVFRLRFALDYATPTAGMCPFSIEGIEREELKFPNGYTSYRWRIPINWPHGQIEFEAPAFTQILIGTPQVQDGQALPADKRRDIYAA